MKRGWDDIKKLGGPFPNWMKWKNDGTGDWCDLCLAIVNADGFDMRSFFAREDAEWDYYGGLTFHAKEDVNKHKNGIRKFGPLREVQIEGAINGKDVIFTVVDTPDHSGSVFAEYGDGCGVERLMDNLKVT